MKPKTFYLAILATSVGLAVSLPAFAQDGGNDRNQRVEQRDGHHGHSQRRGGGNRMARLFEAYDTNEDGQLTQEEIDTARSERLSEFDGDQDGQLTLEEYQALWLDAMRERMVDRFQAHDDDGDGLVTVEEFNEEFSDIVEKFDRNDDGALSEDDRRTRRGAMPPAQQPEAQETE